jgi:hypothetical protein
MLISETERILTISDVGGSTLTRGENLILMLEPCWTKKAKMYFIKFLKHS